MVSVPAHPSPVAIEGSTAKRSSSKSTKLWTPTNLTLVGNTSATLRKSSLTTSRKRIRKKEDVRSANKSTTTAKTSASKFCALEKKLDSGRPPEPQASTTGDLHQYSTDDIPLMGNCPVGSNAIKKGRHNVIDDSVDEGEDQSSTLPLDSDKAYSEPSAVVNNHMADRNSPSGSGHHARRRLSVFRVDQTVPDIDESRGFVSLYSQDSLDRLTPPRPSTRRRLSVSGRVCGLQGNFENKEEFVKSDAPYTDRTLVEMGIGHACKKGMKPESPNQDDFLIVQHDTWRLYGVFDGHGPSGHDVSNFVQTNILPLLVRNMKDKAVKVALKDAFEGIHFLMLKKNKTGEIPFDVSLSGTTASLVHHDVTSGVVNVAHVGDSRVVLGARTPDGAIESIEMTQDHKPQLPKEKKRIEDNGGEVRHLPGDIPHRVFVRNRMFPGLAMSRALGDQIGHQVGITSTPEVLAHQLTKNDLFLIAASDGLWEFITSKSAVDTVASYGYSGVQEATDELAKQAWALWVQEEGDVVDDITVVVIWFRDPGASV